MKKIINTLLALIFMLALLASVTPRQPAFNALGLDHQAANASFKLPVPVEVNAQSSLATEDTDNSEFAQNEFINEK